MSADATPLSAREFVGALSMLIVVVLSMPVFVAALYSRVVELTEGFEWRLAGLTAPNLFTAGLLAYFAWKPRRSVLRLFTAPGPVTLRSRTDERVVVDEAG